MGISALLIINQNRKLEMLKNMEHNSLLTNVLFIVSTDATEEVCLWESFNATCSAGEVVLIESALYGRMHDNRCFNITENESNCSTDVRFEIQKQIGQTQSIHLKLYSDVFTKRAPTCLHGQMPFLEISYKCIKRKS